MFEEDLKLQIWDYLNATALASYWVENPMDTGPYIGIDTLFGTDSKMGLNLSWIKGRKGVPVVLKTSAFDVEAVPRPRVGYTELKYNMPYFKESMYIDEELRQNLLIMLETGNQQRINTIMTRVFNDAERLIESARISRERMVMQLLTTGRVTMSNNGQAIDFDYGQDPANFVVSSAPWSDTVNADAIADIREIQEYNRDNVGTEVTRVLLNSVTFNKLLQQDKIKNSIYLINAIVVGNGMLVPTQVEQYFSSALGIEFIVYNKRYADENGITQKFVPDDIVVVMPSNNVGTLWFGTTPEEADLVSGVSQANTAIVDTGVALCTYKHVDPVTVVTKVSQLCLPSFEGGESVYVLDVSDGATRP